MRGDHAVSVAVRAPPHMSLVGPHYMASAQFLDAVRKVALKDGHRVVLDLRKVEHLSPEMGPLLLAEMERIKFLRGRSSITGISPVAKRPRQTLHALNFFGRLGMYDLYSVEQGDELGAAFEIESGTALDGAVSKTVADQFAEALALTVEQAESVQKALNEALENISEHAYYDSEKLLWRAEPGRWWICAITSAEKQGAFVLACDLGMTIPATVAETARRRGPANVAELAKYVGERLQLTEDERLLGAAFQDRVTRRVEGKGGNGLGKMAALVREFDHGHLIVLSGGASAVVESSSDEVSVSKLPLHFPGTYVIWHLGKELAQ